MSKVMVIIEEPKHCNTCVFRESDYGEFFCTATLPRLELGAINGIIPRHVNCPLKPIPLRKMTESIIYADGKEYSRTNVITEYDEGWNDCIDKLLGEKDE